MRIHEHRREGIALAVAIFGIVVIGALIAGAFFASSQEYRIGRNSLVEERAMAAAEFGQAVVLRDWDTSWNRGMQEASPVHRTVAADNGATADVWISRLNQNTFWVVSEGRATDGSGTGTGSRRRTGLVIRLDQPQIKIPGAITSKGPTLATGTGSLSGTDMNPSGWDCDAAGPQRAGMTSDAAGDMQSSGQCNGFSCVSGNPQTNVDAAAGNDSTYLHFGGLNYDSLTKLANVTIVAPNSLSQILPSYNADNTCKLSDWKNWGEPIRNSPTKTCESYYPIVWLKGTGTTDVNTGRGQGILLVDGNLTLKGKFEWHGPIIIKGNFLAEGVGNKVFGGVMTMNQGCTTNPCNQIKGDAHIQYSRCAIQAAFLTRVRPEVASRAWADMF